MPEHALEQLVESFRRFPGIGPRQARRFAYYLLQAPAGAVTNLVRQIETLKKYAAQCPSCYRFYPGREAKGTEVCDLCRDQNRDQSLLMLVEKDIDLENVRKSGTYQGHFFVLGGLVKILDQKPLTSIRGEELKKVVKKRQQDGRLQEIILALAVNPEGDATADFLKEWLSPLLAETGIKLSTLGRGLSTGVELEYSDAETLKNALRNRQ